MATERQANSIQWGSIVLCLDNAAFRKGFEHGRDYYSEDSDGEEPERVVTLTTGDVLTQIAVYDAKTGHYRFDEEAIEHLEEYLGVFLGYMSGPLPIAMNR